jgi:hypothetical protein
MYSEDYPQVYTSVVKQWKAEIVQCFNNAEKEIYNIDPKPIPDIVGPDEDPNKCACKGTGIITHGDGHTTPCPFHSKKLTPEEPLPADSDVGFVKEEPLVKIRKTTCQCETKCACDDCKCEKSEVDLWLQKVEK